MMAVTSERDLHIDPALVPLHGAKCPGEAGGIFEWVCGWCLQEGAEGQRGGRKTAALLTNASCCQMLPNVQRTRRDKELLSPQTSLFRLPLLLLLPAPPPIIRTLSSQCQTHSTDPLSDPTPCPHQSKGQQKRSRFSQLQEVSSPGRGGAHVPGRNLTSIGT